MWCAVWGCAWLGCAQLSEDEWEEWEKQYSNQTDDGLKFSIFAVAMFMIPVIGWAIFLVVSCNPERMRKNLYRHRKEAVEAFNKEYSGRDITMEIRKRQQAGKDYEEVYAFVKIRNVGQPVDDVELFELAKERRRELDRLMNAPDEPEPAQEEPQADAAQAQAQAQPDPSAAAAQGAYPASAYLPQQGVYPPQGTYPPQQGTYPPQQGMYPPQQGAYPPQQYQYSYPTQ